MIQIAKDMIQSLYQTSTMADISNKTKSLISAIEKVYEKPEFDDTEAIDVSKTVSFFAVIYEKFRNVIEFKDEHIIRRNAINRIINRRIAFNPNLLDEATSIAKELAWAGYYKKDKIPEKSIDQLSKVIEWYVTLKNLLIKGEERGKAQYFSEFIRDLLVCQIEEVFSQKESEMEKTFLFYFYQVLNPNVVVEGISAEEKDLRFYIAMEQVFMKSDRVYLRYNLFKLIFEHLLKIKPDKFVEHLSEFKKSFHFIDRHIDAPVNRNISRYLRNLRPAYLVLKETMLRNRQEMKEILADEKRLTAIVDSVCREKYQISKEKLTRAGVRSILYIFLTKVVFVFIAEYPIMQAMGESIDYITLAINALFPPLLMSMFVLMTGIPGEDNTNRIIERIKQFVYQGNVEKVVFKEKRKKQKNFLFSLSFWSFYFATFAVTFILINYFLDLLNFHLTSKLIFFFFVSAVSFFGYRIRRIAQEYTIKEKENVLTPVIDFFLMPLVSVGKWLSSEIARINFILFIFDFLIEAPFKVLFEVVEEWIGFIRRRKEEIV